MQINISAPLDGVNTKLYKNRVMRQIKSPFASTPQPADANASGRLIGYARVSTSEQSLQMQIDALMRAGVLEDNIHSEKVSGVASARPKLDSAIMDARAGDTIVVWKLDRVGRSLRDLLDRLHDIETRGVGFKSLTEGIDTTTPGGRLIVHVMGSLAQFERDLVVERTKTGVRAAIARGTPFGRKQALSKEQIREGKQLRAQGWSRKKLAKHFGVHDQTVYNWIIKKR